MPWVRQLATEQQARDEAGSILWSLRHRAKDEDDAGLARSAEFYAGVYRVVTGQALRLPFDIGQRVRNAAADLSNIEIQEEEFA